jgi:hypothetical protein
MKRRATYQGVVASQTPMPPPTARIGPATPRQVADQNSRKVCPALSRPSRLAARSAGVNPIRWSSDCAGVGVWIQRMMTAALVFVVAAASLSRPIAAERAVIASRHPIAVGAQ